MFSCSMCNHGIPEDRGIVGLSESINFEMGEHGMIKGFREYSALWRQPGD